MSVLSGQTLAALLLETGRHHHQAFVETDGGDPEWALWYAAHLQTLLFGHVQAIPTRSLLVRLLLEAEEAHIADGRAQDWPQAYASHLLPVLSRLPA